MMDKLHITNGAGQLIQEGTAVVLPTDPSERWIVHFGWYHMNLSGSDTLMTGWYMTRVSDGYIISITEQVLSTLVVLCNGHPVTCPCYPTPVTPGPSVPSPEFIGATLHTVDGIVATNANVDQIFENATINPLEGLAVDDILIGTNGCIAQVTSLEVDGLGFLSVYAKSTGTMLARSDTCEAQTASNK